jgi:hypothetical protein
VHHVARFPPRLGDAQPCDLEFAPPGDHALGGPLREPVANKLDVVSALEKHTLPAHIFCTPIAVPHFRGYIKKRREDHLRSGQAQPPLFLIVGWTLPTRPRSLLASIPLLRMIGATTWTPREDARHIISMRYCHAKEEKLWRAQIGP